MNVKIQGGGDGRYANKNSCTGIVSYLQHEDMDRVLEGKSIEPFFTNENDKVSSREVTYQIDRNKAQLHKTDSKFFVLTVSPSQDELKSMGKTPQEKAIALQEYVRQDIIQQYAENFNRNFNKEDIMYYAKIHHERGDKTGDQMHCHVIISRKDMSNTKKISPQTNHRNTKKGVVKGGFNRESFIQVCETSFDKRFEYNRPIEQSFEYCNAMKNGQIIDMKVQVSKAVHSEKELENQKTKVKSREKGGVEL